uniref:Uncharacterized protein n=1 Tax=Mycena chlorophos TaxID=658473 RepID=A0ABQ0LIT6_MYCCL|nr:predicted protein [Mycena chlorophos]
MRYEGEEQETPVTWRFAPNDDDDRNNPAQAYWQPAFDYPQPENAPSTTFPLNGLSLGNALRIPHYESDQHRRATRPNTTPPTINFLYRSKRCDSQRRRRARFAERLAAVRPISANPYAIHKRPGQSAPRCEGFEPPPPIRHHHAQNYNIDLPSGCLAALSHEIWLADASTARLHQRGKSSCDFPQARSLHSDDSLATPGLFS